jgi:hypothetical protein
VRVHSAPRNEFARSPLCQPNVLVGPQKEDVGQRRFDRRGSVGTDPTPALPETDPLAARFQTQAPLRRGAGRANAPDRQRDRQ